MPWYHGGCRGLTVHAGPDVPSFDDPMIRVALIRGALTCGQIGGLERALNRELWPLGYIARLEHDLRDRSAVLVEIASGR
ncbi:MAG: hypothetical protein ACXWNR_01590 [Candidatus Limnocylindrales bacterium]